MTTGVFIGRFQPLHKGHVDAIGQLSALVDTVVIFVADANGDPDKNPFSVEARLAMLRSVFPTLRVEVVPDVALDMDWFDLLIDKVPSIDLVVTGNSWVSSICSEFRVPVRDAEYNLDVSATEVRRRIFSGEEWHSLVPAPVVPIVEAELAKSS